MAHTTRNHEVAATRRRAADVAFVSHQSSQAVGTFSNRTLDFLEIISAQFHREHLICIFLKALPGLCVAPGGMCLVTMRQWQSAL